MSNYYADIIINISHQEVNKIFQYIIPEELKNKVEIGSPVMVPFGKGNKLIQGYIIDISTEAQISESKLKKIEKILENNTMIETNLIQLAFWMSKRYGSTIISALKTVLPIQQKVRNKESKTVKLNLSIEDTNELIVEFKKKNYIAMEKLLKELVKKPNIEQEFINKALKISNDTLRRMEKKGIITITNEQIIRRPYKFKKEKNQIEPTINQKRIIQSIIDDYSKGIRNTYLLHGITGSGKTEIYMRIIEYILNIGRQAIVLIPEIALSYQTMKSFYERFGSRVGVLHSKLSMGERYDQYKLAKEGKIDIMVGPRSALFSPFENIGVIIIDEEHETTYKSETHPKYNAKEVAMKRAELSNGSVILGSATPSLESYYNAINGSYKLLELKERIDKRQLPEVDIIDMRQELTEGNKTILSYKLRESIKLRLNNKEQIILFINRRGFSRFVSCRKCGFVIKCNHCDIAYTYHNSGQLICHYCGRTMYKPSKCPECGSKYIKEFGAGTQKVEAYISNEFKNAKILRMDADTTSRKHSYEKILTAFSNKEADILIGTQMVAKGHDFPNVTLVGVLAADLSLYMNNFRANERTFNLLTQVAGRAGRGKQKGEVIIQTYSPEHFSIKCAKNQNYKQFYKEEIQFREIMKYPPFTNILSIMLVSKNEDKLIKYSFDLAKNIQTNNLFGYEVVGPASAPVAKLNDYYRKLIMIKSKDYNHLIKVKNQIETIVEEKVEYKDIIIQFDFNPM